VESGLCVDPEPGACDAILFSYRAVLEIAAADRTFAPRPQRLPVVRRALRSTAFARLTGVEWLVVSTLYGSHAA
jgi:hypothetical protein